MIFSENEIFFFSQLFDFDIEVKPILEVLVGKTVEQSLLEVMEEEELANLRQQQRTFEELRNAELVEQQRLEEQERRHREEKVIECGMFCFCFCFWSRIWQLKVQNAHLAHCGTYV